MKFLYAVGEALGFADPEYIRVLRQDAIKSNADVDFERELQGAIGKGRKLIFVLAEWGAGKTHELFSFQQKHGTDYSFAYRSFFGKHSLREAYIHSTHLWARLFFLVLFLAMLLMFGPDPALNAIKGIRNSGWGKLWPITQIIVLALVGVGAAKFAYIFVSVLESIGARVLDLWELRSVKRRPYLLILDDLDRSALSDSDRWAFLSHLWTFGRQIIIPLGYFTDEEEVRYREIAKKLHGAVVKFHPSRERKIDVAKKIWPDLPVTGSEKVGKYCWIDFFSLRDFRGLEDRVARILEGYEDGMLRRAVALKALYREMFFKLGLKGNEHHQAYIIFIENGLKVEVHVALGARKDFLSHSLESFAKSIDKELYFWLQQTAVRAALGDELFNIRENLAEFAEDVYPLLPTK